MRCNSRTVTKSSAGLHGQYAARLTSTMWRLQTNLKRGLCFHHCSQRSQHKTLVILLLLCDYTLISRFHILYSARAFGYLKNWKDSHHFPSLPPPTLFPATKIRMRTRARRCTRYTAASCLGQQNWTVRCRHRRVC